MATIHKLTKDGATIFPATITDAVVHQDTGKTLTSMIKEYNVSELFPTEGIAGGNTYNLALAVQVLGTHLRASEKTGGIKLTFISSVSGGPVEEYYLGKNVWSAVASDWKQRFEVGDAIMDPAGDWDPSTAEAYIDQQIGIEANTRLTQDTYIQSQIPLADEEDLTKSGNYLKFKDRIYNQVSPNGMGYIYLRKEDNFKTVIESVTQGNTIFVIRYDFALTGDVIVPANCILEFDGGSINGAYTLTGNNTEIFTIGLYTIFNNVTLTGSFKKMDIADSTLFNFDTSHEVDESAKFQSLVNIGREIYVRAGRYYISNISITDDMVINGQDGAILNGITITSSCPFCKTILSCSNIDYFHIENIIFEGNVTNTTLPGSPASNIGSCIECTLVDKVEITRCEFRNHSGTSSSIYTTTTNKGQLVTVTDCKNTVIDYCYIHNVAKGEHITFWSNTLPYNDVSLYFEHNYITNLSTSNLTYGNSILGDGKIGFISCCYNTVYNTKYEGTLFNLFAKRVIANNNHIYNCLCNNVFDTSEDGSWTLSDYVECCGNISNLSFGKLLDTTCKVLIVKNNKHIGSGGVNMLGWLSSSDARTDPFNADFFDNGTPLPLEKVVVENNYLDCTAYSDDAYVGFMSQKETIGNGVGVFFSHFKMKSAIIINNTIKCADLRKHNPSSWDITNVPVYLESAESVVIKNNIVYTNCEFVTTYTGSSHNPFSTNHGAGDFVVFRQSKNDEVVRGIAIEDNTIYYESRTGQHGDRIGLLTIFYTQEVTNILRMDSVNILNNNTYLDGVADSYWECRADKTVIDSAKINNFSDTVIRSNDVSYTKLYLPIYRLFVDRPINSQVAADIRYQITYNSVDGYYCICTRSHIYGELVSGDNPIGKNYKIPNKDLYIRPIRIISVSQTDLDNYTPSQSVIDAAYGDIIEVFGVPCLKIQNAPIYRIDNQ